VETARPRGQNGIGFEAPLPPKEIHTLRKVRTWAAQNQSW